MSDIQMSDGHINSYDVLDTHADTIDDHADAEPPKSNSTDDSNTNEGLNGAQAKAEQDLHAWSKAVYDNCNYANVKIADMLNRKYHHYETMKALKLEIEAKIAGGTSGTDFLEQHFLKAVKAELREIEYSIYELNQLRAISADRIKEVYKVWGI